MKEHPILFSGEMVRAILDGRKTQTRRMIKNAGQVLSSAYKDHKLNIKIGDRYISCPYGQPGDSLWVRETWGICPDYNQVRYRADRGMDAEAVGGKWKPSIYMRREYSRINLEITNIRVERLQDIDEADCQREGIYEGVDYSKGITYKTLYKNLWEKINGPGSWDLNPWVWVVEFKRI